MKKTAAVRYAMAVALWIAALGAMPLAWLRLAGKRIPFFGDVQLFSLGELGVLALAAIVLFGDRSLLKRGLLTVTSALIILISFIQLLIFRDSFEEVKIALFYAAMPLAGATLAPELRRIFPVMASFTALILLVCGVTSPDFSGFTGNWNWSQCLLAALLPFLWHLAGVKKWFLWSMLSLLVLFALIFLFHRVEFSRAMVPATVVASTILLFRSKISRGMRFKLLLAAAGFAAAAFIGIAFYAIGGAESRPALWVGACELGFAHPFLGIGAGRFLGLIDFYLPERYFFSAFPALLHPHAHNELLHLWCSFGIAGVAWAAALLKTWCDGADTEKNLPLLWVSAFLAVCGAFDMLLFTPLGGTVFLLVIGMLAAPANTTNQKRFSASRLVSGALLLLICAGDAVSLWRSSRALRQGKLCTLSGKNVQALTCFERSLNLRLLPEAAYSAALLRLQTPTGAPAAWHHLRRMEEESSCGSYGYADRLRGIALVRLGQPERAKLYLQKDRLAHPYSVIGAQLYWRLLKYHLPTKQTEIDRAFADLDECCRLRQIPVSRAMTITEAQDRAPFALEMRRKK